MKQSNSFTFASSSVLCKQFPALFIYWGFFIRKVSYFQIRATLAPPPPPPPRDQYSSQTQQLQTEMSVGAEPARVDRNETGRGRKACVYWKRPGPTGCSCSSSNLKKCAFSFLLFFSNFSFVLNRPHTEEKTREISNIWNCGKSEAFGIENGRTLREYYVSGSANRVNHDKKNSNCKWDPKL